MYLSSHVFETSLLFEAIWNTVFLLELEWPAFVNSTERLIYGPISWQLSQLLIIKLFVDLKSINPNEEKEFMRS